MQAPAEYVALFIDHDNLAIAAQGVGIPLDLDPLFAVARQEGAIRLCRAYGDWSAARLIVDSYYRQGAEKVALPKCIGGKNTADMQLVVDALELVLSPRPPQTVVIASGDRDFVPLVQKLRRYGVRAVGIGVRGTVSQVLLRQCDRFVFYDDLVPPADGDGAAGGGRDLVVAPIVAASLHRFDTPEEATASYRAILDRKRIPLLPLAQRRQLVTLLWALAATQVGGATIAGFTRQLGEAADGLGLSIPTAAVQKLVYSLNLGQCFARASGLPSVVRQADFRAVTVVPLVGGEEALRRVHRGYLTSILRDERATTLLPSGVAQLLFEETGENALAEARSLIAETQLNAAAQRRVILPPEVDPDGLAAK